MAIVSGNRILNVAKFLRCAMYFIQVVCEGGSPGLWDRGDKFADCGSVLCCGGDFSDLPRNIHRSNRVRGHYQQMLGLGNSKIGSVNLQNKNKINISILIYCSKDNKICFACVMAY